MTGSPPPHGPAPADGVAPMLDAGSVTDGNSESQARGVMAQLDLAPHDADLLGQGLRRLLTNSERWRRRGQALATLLSAVRELSDLRDVPILRQRLVERAHDMLGSDATYLSAFDPQSRELRLCATTGARSPSLIGLQVPADVGLHSMVLESRGPRSTVNYAQMACVQRATVTDATAAAEGLVSLLGVPLLAGEAIVGALFVTSRTERIFSPEEIWMLSLLADHAGALLRTAQLLASARDAAREGRRASDELARNAEAAERASAVHSELTALLLRGGNPADLTVALGRVLRCRVAVFRSDPPGPDPFELTAIVPFSVCGAGGPGCPPDTIIDAVLESTRSGRCVAVAAGVAGQTGGLVMAIVTGGLLLGALVVEQGEVPLGLVEHLIVERSAQLAALLDLGPQGVIDMERRVRAELLSDLLSGDPERRVQVAERASSWGVPVGELSAMVVMSVPARDRRRVSRGIGQVAEPRALVGDHDDWIVALLPEPDPGAAAQQIRGTARRYTDGPVLAVGVGISLVPVDPRVDTDLRGQLDAAVGCARILPSLGITDAAVTTDEFLPYTALFGPGEARVNAFVRQVLGPVLDWDAERGGGLLATLVAYLDNRSSPLATGRALHLHKNTVVQRLRRIEELLGNDWQSPDRLFRIMVAVRVTRLASSVDGSQC